MKLSAIAAVVLSAGLAQVAATPIRIVITSAQQDGSEALESVRFGHAVPPATAVATWKIATADGAQVGPAPSRKPCRGRMNRMRQKGIKVSNAFRQFFGMPLIEANPHRLHIMPIGASHKPVEWHQPQFGDFKILPVSNLPHKALADPHPHRHGPFHHHDFQKRPFTQRLNHALLHLGRWEGRAVAFVLGCGIGVLLRLFWVLSIVMYRAIRGHRDDEHEYSHITFIEEYEEPPVQSPPPIYVYPVDEKVALKVDEAPNEAPKAPTTSEESN